MPMPRRWPTVKRCWPSCSPSTRPSSSTISPGVLAHARGGAGSRSAGAGQEAEVLGLGLLGHRQRARRASSRTCGLSVARRAGTRCGRAPPGSRRASMYVWSLRGSAAARRSGPSASSGDLRVVAGGERCARRGRSASSSIASKRTMPLQRTHGFGVRPAACSLTKSSTTSRGSRRARSSVKCGRPSGCASARATATACGEQQLVAPSPCGSDHSSSVTATTSWPRPARAGRRRRCRRRRSWRRACGAARLVGGARRAACRARGAGRRRRASAAWILPGDRPPSSLEMSWAVMRAASRSLASVTSSTVALPAALAAPQPRVEAGVA